MANSFDGTGQGAFLPGGPAGGAPYGSPGNAPGGAPFGGAPAGAPYGDVFAQPAFAAPNPQPAPLPPHSTARRGKGRIALVALVVVALIGGGAFLFFRTELGGRAAFCAFYEQDRQEEPVTVESIERNFKAMRKVAPRSIRPDIDKQLAFIREEPEMNRLVLDTDRLMAMSAAERSQFARELDEALEKYDYAGSAERISAEAERCPNVEPAPTWAPN